MVLSVILMTAMAMCIHMMWTPTAVGALKNSQS